MYFVNLIKEKYPNDNLDIFVDMDGVLADYVLGNLDFLHKRPLMNNINIFQELNKLSNINIHILSVCKKNKEINDKNTWLNQNAIFFPIDNRHIISKESHINKTSKELKSEFLNNYKTKNKIILIDDDNGILKYIKENNPNIILFQDSSLQE